MERENKEYEIIEALSNVSDESLEKLKVYLSKPNRFKKNKHFNPFDTPHEWDFEIGGRQMPRILTCKKCGSVAKDPLNGKSHIFGIHNYVMEGGYPECKRDIIMQSLNTKAGKKIVIIKELNKLFDNDKLKRLTIHECVKCPSKFAEKYADAVWVDVGHIENGENSPIRLLKDEYRFLPI